MVATADEVLAFEANVLNPPDFTIQTGGCKWSVHANVLSRQSKFFEKVCNGEFKESLDKVVTLHDNCPWIIAIMVQCFYRTAGETISSVLEGKSEVLEKMMKQDTSYSDPESIEKRHRNRNNWQIYSLLYQLADKYEILGLKTECMELLRLSLKNGLTLFLEMDKFFLDNDIPRLAKDICQTALEDAWCEHPGQYVYSSWTAAFGTDTDMMEMLQQSIFSNLDIMKGPKSEAIVAVNSAVAHLKVAAERIRQQPKIRHSENKIRAAENKIQEAAALLSGLQKRLAGL